MHPCPKISFFETPICAKHHYFFFRNVAMCKTPLFLFLKHHYVQNTIISFFETPIFAWCLILPPIHTVVGSPTLRLSVRSFSSRNTESNDEEFSQTDLGMRSKWGCLMAQSVMMCLFEGVFHLEEMSTWFRRVLGLCYRAIGLACSFWMLGLRNFGCKDWLLAVSLD
jgi:hypothetical protein